MISFLVCSIRPDWAEKLKENLRQTLGLPFELIAFDNRETKFSISKVYNILAAKAQFDYLCFIHEDVCFNDRNWGAKIIEQLSAPSTGIIGFAGSTGKTKNPSGWGLLKKHNRYHYIENTNGNPITYDNNPNDELFSQVLTVDGLSIFVRKQIWKMNRFDEDTFREFHLYDLDFSLQVGHLYKNYVCHCVTLTHFSSGSYNHSWIKNTIIFHKKWGHELPWYVADLTENEKQLNEKFVSYQFLKNLIKGRYDPTTIQVYAKKHFYAYPFYGKNFTLLIKFAQYIFKKGQ